MINPMLGRARVQEVSNQLLADLPEGALADLRGRLRRISLPEGTIVYELGEPIDYVYFVESGLVSMTLGISDVHALRVTTVGREGMLGLPLFLGGHAALARAQVDVSVVALRLSAADFRALAREPWFATRLRRYAMFTFMATAQEVVCSRAHTTLERCARLLLVAHDRADGARLRMTQELAAQILGIRRVSVSAAAQQLREMGCIDYVRGIISVRDRGRLEAVACDCYTQIRRAVALSMAPHTAESDDLRGRDSAVFEAVSPRWDAVGNSHELSGFASCVSPSEASR